MGEYFGKLNERYRGYVTSVKSITEFGVNPVFGGSWIYTWGEGRNLEEVYGEKGGALTVE